MNKTSEIKRVFFAFEVISPWPEILPTGRCLAENDRHLTVAFLGEVPYPELERILPQCPKPDFTIGKVGIFNKCLFLPERHPNVVSWHINWLDDRYILSDYHRNLTAWLSENNFTTKEHGKDFLPHVTICRKPFDIKAWEKSFSPLPVFIKNLALYESLGYSTYYPCWTHALKAPFEEIDHTADMAFLIRGENIFEIFQHARIALAFSFPELVKYFSDQNKVTSLDEVIIELNKIVTEIDRNEGCPFKAVSFHGEIQQMDDGTFEWEMIVDV